MTPDTAPPDDGLRARVEAWVDDVRDWDCCTPLPFNVEQLVALVRACSAPVWTKERPTSWGAWWFCAEGRIRNREIVDVVTIANKPDGFIRQGRTRVEYVENHPGALWCGPIPEPKDEA